MRYLDALIALLLLTSIGAYFADELPEVTFFGILVSVFYIAIRFARRIDGETLDIMLTPSLSEKIANHKLTESQKIQMKKCLRAYHENQARLTKPINQKIK